MHPKKSIDHAMQEGAGRGKKKNFGYSLSMVTDITLRLV